MHIPRNAIEFNARFDSEASCLDFLENIRWPHGFICPNCQHDDGYRLHCRRLIQCPLCRHQTSVTAGTIFHKTRIPLRIWFYIMFSMSQDKGGASSTRLAAELGMHQTTVWFVMHKLRMAMGRRDELIKLAGFIEMDEAVLGPHARRPSSVDKEEDRDDTDDKKPKKRGPRRLGRKKADTSKQKTQIDVLVLAEREKNHAGTIVMRVLDSLSARDLKEVIVATVDEFQHIKTDGYPTHHAVLRSFPCKYEAVVCSGPDGCTQLPIVHRVISLLKTFLMGTYFGVGRKHLQLYLNEFAFRFNRRDVQHPLWLGLLRASVFALPVSYAELTI
ncbi:MAG: IS1595 family transposase [Cyanobacteria bacterium SZAS LIN-3]|nr:IS1595 family transposase [Cyanobacteria bacterium SZAS LIN-3]